MEKGLIDAKQLANYIAKKYYDYTDHNMEISNIKLQKTLYFLFAMWGGFIKKSKMSSDTEFETNLSSILFDNDIQAWVYGPVVPEVFFENKKGNLSNYDFDEKEFFSGEKILLKETLDSIMNDIFAVSDFKLVSISHEDKCWQNHFDPVALEHKELIPKEEILMEYANRECI